MCVPRIACELVPLAATARPGERLSYRVVNTGEAPLLFGEDYSLQRRTAQGWSPDPHRLIFRAIGYGIGRGQSRELAVRLSDDQAPGRYRLLKSVRLSIEDAVRLGYEPPASAPSVTADFEFEVR